MGSPQQFILGSDMKWTPCLLFVASVATALPSPRTGKVLGLFSVVTFPNDECKTIMTPSMSGVCVTSEECSNSGDTIATASGNCASGFGVCCMRRIVAPGSITQDLTHIQNEDFPSAEAALRATAPVPPATDRAVNIMGGANICALKVEFITVQLLNPSATGVCGEEAISVRTPARNPGAGFGVENLCGVLTGQHIFVDVAPAVGAMAMTLNIDTSNLSGDRMWKILIRQIQCDDVNRPPGGCLQYHTGLSGQLTSFNGARTGDAHQMIRNQNYKICIKRAAGMCGVTYREATSGAGTIDSFNLGAAVAAKDPTDPGNFGGNSGVGDTCTALNAAAAGTPTQAIIIQPMGLLCGGKLSSASNEIVPGPVAGGFDVRVVQTNTDTQAGSGFNLVYTQTSVC